MTEDQFIALLMRTVQRGSVITLDGRGGVPFQSATQHHFIVLNYDPQSNEFLVAVNHTSHVSNRITQLHQRGNVDVNATTVVLRAGQYSFFPRQTIFDCNSVHELSAADLLSAYRAGNLHIPNDTVRLTDEDLEKLAQAALNSRSVSPIQKRMIDPSRE